MKKFLITANIATLTLSVSVLIIYFTRDTKQSDYLESVDENINLIKENKIMHHYVDSLNIELTSFNLKLKGVLDKYSVLDENYSSLLKKYEKLNINKADQYFVIDDKGQVVKTYSGQILI